jgi:putative transposase
MANTYTQLLVQLVFAVKGRRSLVAESFREQVEKYMCGILTNHQCKPLAVYCNPDHCHLLFGLHPTQSVADVAKAVKANSSRYINENGWVAGRFEWQQGYGAFSYARSQLDVVVNYIRNQPIHHAKKHSGMNTSNFWKNLKSNTMKPICLILI